MSTNAVAGYGFELQIGDGASPEGFVPISEVYEIGDVMSPVSIYEDVSHLGTALDGKDEVDVGSELKDITFSVNYIAGDSTHGRVSGLLADRVNKVVRNFRIKFAGPDNEGVSFAARVKELSNQPINRRSAFRATVTLSLQTWVPGSSAGW